MRTKLRLFNHPARSPRTRRGMTLIEILAVISVLMAIGISAAGILGQLTDTAVDAKTAQQFRDSIRRLSVTLREDVRQAESVDIADEGRSIDLNSRSVSVTYRWDEGAAELRRQSSAASAVTRFERYPWPPGRAPLFEQQDRLVSLKLHRGPASLAWLIEAKLP